MIRRSDCVNIFCTGIKTTVFCIKEVRLSSRPNKTTNGAELWSSSNNKEFSGYTDKTTDSMTGFIYMGQRSYDSTLGRWLSPDLKFEVIETGELQVPWEASGSYIYGLNSPVNGQDENGAVFEFGTGRAEAARRTGFVTLVQTIIQSSQSGTLPTSFAIASQNNLERFMGKELPRGEGEIYMSLLNFASTHAQEIVDTINAGKHLTGTRSDRHRQLDATTFKQAMQNQHGLIAKAQTNLNPHGDTEAFVAEMLGTNTMDTHGKEITRKKRVVKTLPGFKRVTYAAQEKAAQQKHAQQMRHQQQRQAKIDARKKAPPKAPERRQKPKLPGH